MDKHICVLCGNEFTGYGNNPSPLAERGLCCDSCNTAYVIPARLKEFSEKCGIKE